LEDWAIGRLGDWAIWRFGDFEMVYVKHIRNNNNYIIVSSCDEITFAS
jgi:hypothetical protein